MYSRTVVQERLVLLIVVVFLVLPGCKARDSSQGMPIKGIVTFDNEPVENGRIIFLDKATNEPVSASIHGGKYEAKLVPGEKVVKISADKVVGMRLRDSQDPNSGEFEFYEQYIPQKYNTSTTLALTMGDKAQTQDYKLTSD